MIDRGTALEALREGEIEIVGRIVASSNNAMLVTVTRICPDPEPTLVLDAIYKPTLGERPLDDFPDGTLARREVAAWHVSEATGWGIVPPTILRDGPFGEGMVQAFVDADPDVDVVAMVVDDDAAAAPDGGPRRGDEQHRPQGRPHPPGRWRAARLRRRPRGHLLAGPQAADRAVGLARRSRSRRTRSTGWSGSGPPSTAELGETLARSCCRASRCVPRPAASTRCWPRGRFPYPSPDWPAIPWPPF